MKNVDGTEHMREDIEAEVKRFLGVPKNIIDARAEHCAEAYLSSSRGIEDDDPFKRTLKEAYIEQFKELLFEQMQ